MLRVPRSVFVVAVLVLAGAPACRRTLVRERDERLPLPTTTIPSFVCSPLPETDGDCLRAADCGLGQVCGMPEPAADGARVSLRCGPALGDGLERARCTDDGDCASGLCALASVCLEPCGGDDDCGPGQRCASTPVHVRGDGLSRVPACIRSSAFPPAISLVTEPYTVAADTLSELELGAGAGREVLYVGSDCSTRLAVDLIVKKPRGEVLFDYADLVSGGTSLNPSVNVGELVSVLLPNNPAVDPSPAGYTLGVQAEADAQVTVVRASGSSGGDQLDLNVFYVGGGESLVKGGLRPGSKDMERVFSTLADNYQAIGLRLGTVREYEVTGALRDEFAVLETDMVTDDAGNVVDFAIVGLEELFKLSAGVDDGGLNLFVISDMGDVLGIAGGIPGALGIHGTSASGVVVAADTTGLGELPYVIQHELSHQMGLFHTSEMDGSSIEPLADTSVCDPSFDRNGDGVVSPRECRRADADNLMFWSGTGSGLSDEQVAVLAASPILR